MDWYLNIHIQCKEAILSISKILEKETPLTVSLDCSHSSKGTKEPFDFKVT